jgi:hypothetical protein
MRKDHENKVTMFKSVDAFFDANTTKLAVIAALVRYVASFKSLLADILSAVGTVDEVTSGKTQIKYDAEDNLVAIMLQVGPTLFAYANDVNDLALRGNANFSKTSLRRMRDIELVAAGKALYTEATAVVGNLADYSITTPTLDDLKAKVDAYEKALGSQGSSVSQHTTAVFNIAEKISAVDTLLTDNIDPVMQSIEKDDPAFFREYKQTRMIKDLGAPRKQTAQKTTTAAPAATPAK